MRHNTHRRHDRTARPRTDAYARDARHTRRPDSISSGWREEYRAQGAVLPDGGEREHESAGDSETRYVLPDPGAHVGDREDPDAELVVLAVLEDTRADEHRIPATGKTVYQHNDGYPPWAPVVRCAYADEVAGLDGWRHLEDLREAVEEGALRAYSFPVPRLEGTDDDAGGERP